MTFQFKKVETRNLRSDDRISITTSNSIGITQTFYKDQNIANFKYVVFYYDAAVKALGILFTNDENEKFKFTIIHSKKGYGASIVVRSFFNNYKIDPKIYHNKYKWQIVDEPGVGKLYVINLQERQNKA